uniref:RFX-type winged-helix domain-containing protein n=1 Tax=Plectus sambesii TaxID=2011161 RepID=A0A914VAJ1_9BILA
MSLSPCEPSLPGVVSIGPPPPSAVCQSPGTYTVYAESYPYYQQYQPSLHSPAQGGQTTYIIPSGQQTSPNSLDDESAGHLSHTTRASPATIQWLLQNYETAEGVSLPRCTLYSHYLRHCADNKLDPVNAASFGKLIRSVFLGLRTRRLGTRGNSKYHYYGIRIKPESPLNRVTEDQMPMAMRNTPQHPGRTKQQRMSTRSASGGGGSGEFSSSGQQQTTAASTPSPGYPSQPNSLNAAYATGSVDSNNSFNDVPDDNHRQMLGSGEVPDVPGPDEQGLEAAVQPLGLTLHQVARFVNGYKQNNEDVLECIKNLRFGEIDECWRNFWQPENEQEENEEDKDGESQSGLSQSQLFSLSTVPQIQQYVQNMDFAFYQVLVDVLIPDVLKNIPAPLTQQIRNFAKSLENQLMLAMQGAPDVMQKMKLTAVKTLAQTLRRYTSLNHLAQAARAVLQQPQQITQMLNDLNRVDFVNVQEQATWVCKCDPLLVEQLQTNFKANLGKQKTLEQWAEWLEAVVDQVLASYHDKSLHEIANVAKQFLLKWSFYSSMVIRDLTLRSAQSFGSFHLIRLLYDEYMFYLVEQRLAKAANLSCIAVMAQHPDLFPNASLPVNLHTSEPIFINGAADVLMGNMEDFEEQRALPITGREDEQTGRDDRPDEQHPAITDHTQAASPHRLSDDTADIGAVKRARLE